MRLNFYDPAIFNGGGGGTYSITAGRPSRTNFFFFDKNIVLDSYFFHRYIII